MFASRAGAQPIISPWTVSGEDDAVAVAAAPFGGFFAVADSFGDRVEVRDFRQNLLRSISRAEMAGLLPWMNLDGGPDGPDALAFTSSGKSLFILVHDDTLPPDGQGSDGILRLDVATNSLSLFARLDLFDRGDEWPYLAAAHHRAILYAGSAGGQIRAYLANAAAASGTLLATWVLPTGGAIRGLAVDRDAGTMFAANATGIYRAALTNNFTIPPAWTLVATGSDIRDLAWGETFGGTANRGLYVLSGVGANASRIDFISAANAYSPTPTIPSTYFAGPGVLWHAIDASGDGRLIVGQAEDAATVSDGSDTRLTFDPWLADEFAQVVTFARGLISPDGEPPGWVIDGDTIPSLPRFHPATPDGAAWTVLLLLASDAINDDALSQSQVRAVLGRYGGLAADGIAPSRTTDGIFRHWIDPATGGVKPGWDPEFATMSTMKMVMAASRAMGMYPDDPQIARAASRIIFRTRNWDAYVQSGTQALYLKGLPAGGPDTSVPLRPFHEGILFVAEAAAYGGTASDGAYAAWLNRALWPTASYIPGLPITVIASGQHESTFISVYPALLLPEYRADAAWRGQLGNIRWSAGAWTDDFGARYLTVFSAGTTRSDWGGYHADTLGSHPGDITTFTSLMGLSAFSDATPAAQAYHAYRKGARQAFRTGASLLYRRSDADRAYTPNSAGLPDVALGALALGELMRPGVLDAVLSRPLQPMEMCPVDVNSDGAITIDDAYAVEQSPVDLNGDGAADTQDAACLKNWLRRHEKTDLAAR
ncbi:hypothetical protein PHYC_03127 [Phycisphaerales bacterium]|nr:hypothetical protein PHYC_03127 [Phycisphaerales bacterium]